jgi:predicted DsbA family dithiol-disulfide isomerase
LEAALTSLRGQINFQIKWLPFQLNALASTTGVNKLNMYMQKFNLSRADAVRMGESMKRNFANVGLPYKFTDQALTGNTFNAHRLISYAYHKGGAPMQNLLVEELFLNYFGQELFLNDRHVLKAAAVKAGFSEAEAILLVDDEQVHADVTRQELAISRQMGVSGVPFFVFEGSKGRQTMSGAQDSNTIVQHIRAVL